MTEKMQEALNEQITAELWSANLYLSMSFYMKREGFDGMAHWLNCQASEEKAHALEIADYMVKREGTPKIDKIDVVPQGWGNALEVFEHVVSHEKHVSKLIDELVQLASAEHDNATQDFLWGFVREQVEEEATALGIVNMLKRAGEAGLFCVDAKLGERK